jgi:hypothetical protein
MVSHEVTWTALGAELVLALDAAAFNSVDARELLVLLLGLAAFAWSALAATFLVCHVACPRELITPQQALLPRLQSWACPCSQYRKARASRVIP